MGRAGRSVFDKDNRDIDVEGKVRSDNLPEPIEYPLSLQVEYEEREIQREDVEFPSGPPDAGWLP